MWLTCPLARAPCVPGAFCGDVLLTDRQKQDVLQLRKAMLFLSSIAKQKNLTHVTEVRPL